MDKYPALPAFLDALGLTEGPMGMHYTDREPAGGLSPRPQAPLSREAEASGAVDWQSVQDNFSCVLGVVWRARKKQAAAYFSRERFGCPGAAFYLGFMRPYLAMHPPFISTGIPGLLEGERYAASHEAAVRFFDAIDPRPAPAAYCVIKPLSHFVDEEPEVVIFFCRPESLSGLYALAAFLTGDIDAVRAPFGPGCSGLVTWPVRYAAEGRPAAVLGGFDPSCRLYLKTDELTFAVSTAFFLDMLDRWDSSFLSRPTWAKVKKRVARSARTWGEAAGEK